MPKVKDIGLGKHLDSWKKEQKKKQAEKEKLARLERKAKVNRVKAKYNQSKKSLRASRRHIKVRGGGITIGSLFKKRR